MRVLLSAVLLALFAPQESASPAIPLSEYQGRRALLAEKLAKGPVVLEAEALAKGEQGIDENAPRLDYAYLAGYHNAGDLLVLLPGEPEAFVFTKGDVAALREKTGLKNVLERDRFAAFAKERFAAAEVVHARVSEATEKAISESAPRAKIEKVELGGQVARQRMVKSEAEIGMVKKASEATAKAHVEALKACRDGLNEKELQKVIEETFRKEGCDGLAFPSIVGSGKNGTLLHYMRNDQPMPKNSLVVCDIGASYRGYASDVTRTLPTDGRFTDEQRKAYQCVLDAVKAAEKILKAGATWHELDAAASRVFADRKLTKWSYAQSKDWSVRHGLGHFVGLSVHDTGHYGARLAAGMVITIEPGYYDKDAGWGIRIEDTYVVTKDGFERLSAGAPREIDEIERIMKDVRGGK